MGFMVPIVTGGISAFSAIKNGRAAGRQTKIMEGAQQQQMGALAQNRQQGTDLFQAGMPATQNALNYYATLLRGSRAAMQQATAGPAAQLTDTYRGAERGLERMGIRGGEAATARAELSRDRANAIAQLTTGQQGAAAAALGGLGSRLTGQGVDAVSGAATGYGNLAGQAGDVAAGYRQDARDDWAGVGKAFGEGMRQYGDWRKGGGRWHFPWHPAPGGLAGEG